MENDLIYRLRKRAEIRRQIPTRKSVLEGKPDRIADILEEAADEIEKYKDLHYLTQQSEHWNIHTMKKLINWFDPRAEKWRNGYFFGYTSKGDTVIETPEGWIVQLPNGTAKIKDLEQNEY